MMEFLQANWGSIVAFLAVALLVFLAIRRMWRDKKAGIGPCGQKCANCPHCSGCGHEKKR